METNGLVAMGKSALFAGCFGALVAFGGALGGCAADTSSGETAAPADDGAEVDELNATSLRGSTAIKGTVATGSTVTLQYDRSDRLYPRSIPYLAVEIVDPPAANGELHTMTGELLGAQSITVHGDFPGKPRVLVVDAAFRPIASAVAQTLPDGTSQATLDVERGAGKRFVLVRDTRWSKPMEFQVGVGR